MTLGDPYKSQIPRYISLLSYMAPTTVAARSNAWTAFARSNAGIVGSNTTQDVDICMFILCR
jgi:hypothetical protein